MQLMCVFLLLFVNFSISSTTANCVFFFFLYFYKFSLFLPLLCVGFSIAFQFLFGLTIWWAYRFTYTKILFVFRFKWFVFGWSDIDTNRGRRIWYLHKVYRKIFQTKICFGCVLVVVVFYFSHFFKFVSFLFLSRIISLFNCFDMAGVRSRCKNSAVFLVDYFDYFCCLQKKTLELKKYWKTSNEKFEIEKLWEWLVWQRVHLINFFFWFSVIYCL